MPLCNWHTFWMAPSLICFLVLSFYIERKWLMRSLATIFPLKSKLSRKFRRFNTLDRFSIKTKNCKALYEVQIASRLKEIFQPPPTNPSPDKILLCLWNKNFIMEIYRNIQAFTFKVFQECGSWVSRNDTVQILFLAPNKNVCWKICKIRKGFGCVAGAISCKCQVCWDSLNEWGLLSETVL